MSKIILTGYRGVGKSETGKRLANKLQLPFLDTDLVIEANKGCTIREIFEREGEIAFRNIEKDVIRSLRTFHGVISTGGGAVLSADNIRNLRENAIVILLTAGTKTILMRTGDNTRPNLTQLSPEDEINLVMKERNVFYQAFSDFCICTDNLSPDMVVERIESLLKMTLISNKTMENSISKIGQKMDISDKESIRKWLNSPVHFICAIACNPCGHSKSPLLYQKLFSQYKLPYKYFRFESEDFGSIIANILKLPFKGLSVTIPFKNDAVRYCDTISNDAYEIGAVNSIVRCGNSLYGHNTDWKGIIEPLADFDGSGSVVIGAGGAAMAAVYGLLSLGLEVTVVNRTIEKAYEIRDRLHCNVAEISEIEKLKPDLIVNATSLGMNGEGIPVNPDIIKEGMTVFDLVYTPKETPLIKEAMKKGAKTIPGTEMFAVQARHQFKLFTGIDVPLDKIRGFLA